MKKNKQRAEDIEEDAAEEDASPPAKRKRSETGDGESGEKSSAVAKQKYEERLRFVTIIAKPMATWKLARKLFRLIRKASKVKKHLVCGLKAVQRGIRKGEKGIVLLAGDVTPIDVMCHMPIVCEDLKIPYAFVPSKLDIGEARGVNRGLIIVLIKEHEDYKDLFAECKILSKQDDIYELLDAGQKCKKVEDVISTNW